MWRHAIKAAKGLSFEETHRGPSGEILLFCEPIGVTLGILTFNTHVVFGGMTVIPVLLAGCPMLVTHRPESALK